MSSEASVHPRGPCDLMQLYSLLGSVAQDLIAAVERRLRGAATPHYQAADPGLLRERVGRLVGAFLDGACHGPEPFVKHVRRITEERIGEGYFLDELQLALGALEERAWQALVERSENDALVARLACITTLVGAAKDELARVYLLHKEQADLRACDLQRQLDELFKGTDAPAAFDLTHA